MQHVGNIFAVKFIPYHNEAVVSGAADGQVRSTSLQQSTADAPLDVFHCHRGMVHDITVDALNPLVFLTAGSEGCVRQFDLREGHRCGRAACPMRNCCGG